MAMSLLFLFGCTKQAAPATIQDTAPVRDTSTASGTTIPRQTYTNKADRFTISFPSSRSAQEKVYWSSITFTSPTGGTDKIKENLRIEKTSLSKAYTVDEYYAMNQKRLNAQEWYTEIENANIKINWLDAKKLIFKTLNRWYHLQFEEILIIKDSSLYTLTYAATEVTFNDFASDVTKMVSSFEIK